MKSFAMGFFVVAAAFSFCVNAKEPNMKVSAKTSCMSVNSTSTLGKDDPQFPAVVAVVHSTFSPAVKHTTLPVSSAADDFASPGIEWIKQEVATSTCGSTSGSGPTTGPSAIGGCSHVGCTGGAGIDYSSMPVGSIVTISTCGSSVSESGTFKRAPSGDWVMTSYKTEQAVSCPAAG